MPINGEELGRRVRVAMADRGLNQQRLAALIGMDQSALSRALAGKRHFKSLEIARIAEALGVSSQHLLSDRPPAPVLVAARASTDAASAVAAGVEYAQQILDLDRLLADLGFAVRPTPALDCGPGEAHAQGEALAERVRAGMASGTGDLPYQLPELSALLEAELGVDVAFQPLGQGLDGLSFSCDGFRLALVSSGVSATRQRFTLAHEIGHLVAGDSQELRIDENIMGRKSPEERRANAFAAAFLMPAGSVRAAVPSGFVSEELVATLLARYGVSLDALAFRLHNLGVVDAAGRDRIRTMSSSRIALRDGRTSDLRARNDRRVPGNVLARAVEAYVHGKLSVRPLAQLLGVDAEQLLDEIYTSAQPRYLDDDAEPVL